MTIDDYRAMLKKLLSLLEEDAIDIEGVFQGEVLDGYRKVLYSENSQLQQMIQKTYY